MASIFISDSSDADAEPGEIALGQVTFSDGQAGVGDTKTLYLHNSGRSTVREIEIGVEGDESKVELSGDGETWSEVNGTITYGGALHPGTSMKFYVRPIYSLEDREGRRDFRLVVNLVAMGE